MKPVRNLITDVAGVRVGNAGDPGLASGVTAVIFDAAEKPVASESSEPVATA